jgi:Tol biopolymer transport system component
MRPLSKLAAIIALLSLIVLGQAPVNAVTYRQLTTDGGREPRWSRDGTDRILYQTGYHLYTIPATGGARVEITNSLAGWSLGGLSWSPSGNEVSFFSWLINYPQGAWITCSSGARGDSTYVVIGHPGYAVSGAWSPNGDQFALTDPPSAPSVYICPAVASGFDSRVRLESIGGSSTSPTWSPDQQYIAFFNNSGTCAIYKVPSQGGAATCVMSGVYPNGGIDWSADGMWIVAGGWHGGNLWIVPASGGAAIALQPATPPNPDGPQYAGPLQPSWSPDGTQIAFAGPGGIWIASDLEVPVAVKKSTWGEIRQLFH